jgi:NAD(P)H-quinone oxidoreductase subunit 5
MPIESCTKYFLFLISIPLVGLLLNLLVFNKNQLLGSRIASRGISIAFIAACIAWSVGLPFSEKREFCGFLANEISWLIATLILFVSSIIHHFSERYMAGDRNYRRYFLLLNLITISTLLLVASDNIVILISLWLLSNTLLVLLMMHKSEWAAAKNSGILAIKTFLLGVLFLTAGIGLLSYESGTLSLSFITQNGENLSSPIRTIALLFIVLAAFSQSGGWPFHSWLISSLNSPTPVSAFMHAGLVNGGGLLLSRFAPLFFHESALLSILFILAISTLILGGVWKLLQSDIKRMLACSTMTQMGFMMMQCSLGLFPAALAHLCLHGLFKALLFLRSGSTIGEHLHRNNETESKLSTFFLSSLCGAAGALAFVFASGLSVTFADTTCVLTFFSWVASTQVAHALLRKKQSSFFILTASFCCVVTGFMYGFTVAVIERAVAPLQIWQPQLLQPLHIFAIALISCIWIALNMKPLTNYQESLWWRFFYVRMLNACQPDPATTTSNRNGYKF